MKNFTLILLSIIMLSSCATMQLKTLVPYSPTNQLDTIVLMPILIGAIQQPVLPLIDAGIFNAKTDKIAPEILDMEQKAFDMISLFAARNLKTILGPNVLYGDELYNRNGFAELSKKLHKGGALKTNDKAFPVVLINNADFNPFDFTEGKVSLLFKDSIKYKNTAKLLCDELKVDAIAISYSKIVITGASAFGISGAARLDTYIFLIDKNGEMILNGYGFSKPVTIDGSKIGQYKDRIEEFPFLFNSLLKKSVTVNP